ncbi:MAG: membrane protein [Hyphobacterium sp.]|nr:MAG: membrane protein [Hyphobacterium sp.]
MNWQPMLDASVAIQLHFYTVIPAFVLGTIQMILPKGTRIHRWNGYVYMALMMMTATAAFFIPSFMGGRFGYIHLFVLLTYVSIPWALYNARKGNVAAHRNSMIGLYIGGILIAGGLAFAPGRLMHDMLFGG